MNSPTALSDVQGRLGVCVVVLRGCTGSEHGEVVLGPTLVPGLYQEAVASVFIPHVHRTEGPDAPGSAEEVRVLGLGTRER